jgi:hypothetical protein
MAELLDWEVVEPHAVAPVQVLFKEDGAYLPESGGLPLTLENGIAGVKICQIAPSSISGSYTFDMHQSCRTAVPASPHPKGAAAGQPRPISDPITNMNERADRAPKMLHRKSRSAGAAQPDARTVTAPFTFGVLKRTTPPASTPSKEELAVVDAPEPRVQRRRAFGASFSFLLSRHGGTAWEVGRAYRARRVEHRSVDRRSTKSWNQDRDRSRLQLFERKRRCNPKLRRRTIAQDRTFPLYGQNLLWHPISPLWLNHATTKLRRGRCSNMPEKN